MRNSSTYDRNHIFDTLWGESICISVVHSTYVFKTVCEVEHVFIYLINTEL